MRVALTGGEEGVRQVGNAGQPKVCFLLTTKDRVDLTLRCLQSMDTCGGFDLVWVDGSTTPEGKALPQTIKLHNCRIAELYQDFRPRHTDPRSKAFAGNLGSHWAIDFGFRRLIDLGYDYCGIIENDIGFEPDWLPRVMELFALGKRDGFSVGAVTARSIASRAMFRHNGYLVMWLTGAGMVLFTQEAARIVIRTYANSSAKKLARFYRKTFRVDLRGVWEMWCDKKDRPLCPDWLFSSHLYEHGFASLGTIPSLAFNMEVRIEETLRTTYVQRPEDIPLADDRTVATFKAAISAAAARPRSRRLVPSFVDTTRGKLFRAQLHSKFVRDCGFWVYHALHPISSMKSLIRKARKGLARP